jgi:hypothetical protein
MQRRDRGERQRKRNGKKYTEGRGRGVEILERYRRPKIEADRHRGKESGEK